MIVASTGGGTRTLKGFHPADFESTSCPAGTVPQQKTCCSVVPWVPPISTVCDRFRTLLDNCRVSPGRVR